MQKEGKFQVFIGGKHLRKMLLEGTLIGFAIVSLIKDIIEKKAVEDLKRQPNDDARRVKKES